MMTLPRAPVQMAPQGGGNAIRDPVLQWRDPGVPNYNQATKYAVTFPPSFQSEVAAPATSVIVSQVLYFGASYRWTVQAINEHGSSPVSSATFSTQGPPAPTNLSPNNAVNVIIPATLTWIDVGAQLGSPALQFQLQIYQGILEAPSGSPQPFVTQQSNFTVPLGLTPGQTYTWSVTAQYPPLGSLSSQAKVSLHCRPNFRPKRPAEAPGTPVRSPAEASVPGFRPSVPSIDGAPEPMCDRTGLSSVNDLSGLRAKLPPARPHRRTAAEPIETGGARILAGRPRLVSKGFPPSR